jgi:hypothetical protein
MAALVRGFARDEWRLLLDDAAAIVRSGAANQHTTLLSLISHKKSLIGY